MKRRWMPVMAMAALLATLLITVGAKPASAFEHYREALGDITCDEQYTTCEVTRRYAMVTFIDLPTTGDYFNTTFAYPWVAVGSKTGDRWVVAVGGSGIKHKSHSVPSAEEVRVGPAGINITFPPGVTGRQFIHIEAESTDPVAPDSWSVSITYATWASRQNNYGAVSSYGFVEENPGTRLAILPDRRLSGKQFVCYDTSREPTPMMRYVQAIVEADHTGIHFGAGSSLEYDPVEVEVVAELDGHLRHHYRDLSQFPGYHSLSVAYFVGALGPPPQVYLDLSAAAGRARVHARDAKDGFYEDTREALIAAQRIIGAYCSAGYR